MTLDEIKRWRHTAYIGFLANLLFAGFLVYSAIGLNNFGNTIYEDDLQVIFPLVMISFAFFVLMPFLCIASFWLALMEIVFKPHQTIQRNLIFLNLAGGFSLVMISVVIIVGVIAQGEALGIDSQTADLLISLLFSTSEINVIIMFFIFGWGIRQHPTLPSAFGNFTFLWAIVDFFVATSISESPWVVLVALLFAPLWIMMMSLILLRYTPQIQTPIGSAHRVQ